MRQLSPFSRLTARKLAVSVPLNFTLMWYQQQQSTEVLLSATAPSGLLTRLIRGNLPVDATYAPFQTMHMVHSKLPRVLPGACRASNASFLASHTLHSSLCRPRSSLMYTKLSWCTLAWPVLCRRRRASGLKTSNACCSSTSSPHRCSLSPRPVEPWSITDDGLDTPDFDNHESAYNCRQENARILSCIREAALRLSEHPPDRVPCLLTRQTGNFHGHWARVRILKVRNGARIAKRIPCPHKCGVGNGSASTEATSIVQKRGCMMPSASEGLGMGHG